ncbi:uncharacterized protein ACBT57_023578 [Dama dama]
MKQNGLYLTSLGILLRNSPVWQEENCASLKPVDCCLPSSSAHAKFPGKNTGVDCHFLIQGIFPNQGWIPHLLHGQVDSSPVELPFCKRYYSIVYAHLDDPVASENVMTWKTNHAGIRGCGSVLGATRNCIEIQRRTLNYYSITFGTMLTNI